MAIEVKIKLLLRVVPNCYFITFMTSLCGFEFYMHTYIIMIIFLYMLIYHMVYKDLLKFQRYLLKIPSSYNYS